VPIKISRTIRWIDEIAGRTPSSKRPRIRPPGIDDIFADAHPDFGRFICVSDDIRKDDHFGLMMHRTIFTDFWFRHHDGTLAKYQNYHDGPAKEFLSSFYLQTNRAPDFIGQTAKAQGIRGDARMPVFYFPTCTILMGVEMLDLDAALEGRHPAHRCTSPQDLLGSACALAPTSNHQASAQVSHIMAELATHTEIVSIISGVNLELGEVIVPKLLTAFK
jgi:hypothetical protein